MADVSIKYKGETLATMSASGSKNIECGGSWLEDDITVEYERPSGGSANLQTKSVTITANTAANTPLEITSDDGYDGIEKLLATVAVGPSGTYKFGKITTYSSTSATTFNVDFTPNHILLVSQNTWAASTNNVIQIALGHRGSSLSYYVRTSGSAASPSYSSAGGTITFGDNSVSFTPSSPRLNGDYWYIIW